MKWEKKGLIYCPKGERGYDLNSFMTPSALLIDDNTIRIWGGVRDIEGVSRICYVDVDADNPLTIKGVSEHPVLDIGNDGCFDDNGAILGDVVKVDKKYYMYYVGFQHVAKVKFFAFSGLAISTDGGNTFGRYSEAPVLDRTNNARYIRAIHTVLLEDGIFKTWYAIGNDWKYINSIPYPAYNIWYVESKDGVKYGNEDLRLCVDNMANEYRIGRPKVYRRKNKYVMFYTRDFIHKEYAAGYAESEDGLLWIRKDEALGIEKSTYGWDSEMICYPVLLDYKDKTYMFYNGNGMGKSGVGYAELIKE